MPKKRSLRKQDGLFQNVRKQVPRNYMADLAKLLPDLTVRKIRYALEAGCQDIELQERVLLAMKKIAQDTQKKKQKLQKLAAKS